MNGSLLPCADLQLVAMPQRALLQTLPVATVPPGVEQVDRLEQTGDRLLMTNQGVMLEVRREWIAARFVCAAWPQHMPTPFGRAQAFLDMQFSREALHEALVQFVPLAKEAGRIEVAAALAWNRTTKRVRLVPSESLAATAVEVIYRIGDLADDEVLIGDIHSHGYGSAGFSATDDEDDGDDVKVAMVIGNVESDRPSIAARVAVMGRWFDMPFSGLN